MDAEKLVKLVNAHAAEGLPHRGEIGCTITPINDEDNADYQAMRGNSLANVHVEDNPEDWADCGICGNSNCVGDCMSEAQIDKLDEDDFHFARTFELDDRDFQPTPPEVREKARIAFCGPDLDDEVAAEKLR